MGTRSILVQVMAYCLTAPSHYLNQCWFIISKGYHRCVLNHHFGPHVVNWTIIKKLPRQQWRLAQRWCCRPNVGPTLAQPTLLLGFSVNRKRFSKFQMYNFVRLAQTNRIMSFMANYNDVIMSAMASQIIGVLIVCLDVCSGSDQRKHQSSASLTFMRGIHRWPVISPQKGPVTRKMFPFDDVIIIRTSFTDTGLLKQH